MRRLLRVLREFPPRDVLVARRCPHAAKRAVHSGETWSEFHLTRVRGSSCHPVVPGSLSRLNSGLANFSYLGQSSLRVVVAKSRSMFSCNVCAE